MLLLKFVVFIVIVFTHNNFAFASVSSVKTKVYECIFEYGVVKKIPIANSEFLVPQKDMPMPFTAVRNPDCFILKNNRQQNTALANYHSSSFLTNFILTISKSYKKSCNGKACESTINCKILTQSVANAINQYISEDSRNYGRLAESEEIVKKAVKDDKECIKKIYGLYSSKRFLFYKDPKCINYLLSNEPEYITHITELLQGTKSSYNKEFINCLSDIKNDTQ
ncbi:hypothetical protein Deia_00106 [Candidatus Deianiraea vastatrix]|uniref:Uncharacterized protein n=2 Tax=Candidatus Deianiraea vastatrix TaxID=2163644 RepID=A0A5B8XC53_9RICK|nr:hypothetical protein Deia_00106 [Candidatus Deianiraea vastatrix]